MDTAPARSTDAHIGDATAPLKSDSIGAERLIVGSQLPLAAIAAAVGFSDQSHLNRVMRAQRGLIPGQLRNSLT